MAGIMKSAKDVGMVDYLPCDVRETLEALFEYRNKMFHHGFEWPPSEAEKFHKRLESWPEGWFEIAWQDNVPWMFYMSPSFVDHCLDTIEDIINGLGKFLVDQLINDN